MNTLTQDIRYGLRGMWRSRGFTAVAVLSLALGIGANAAIFSLVNAVLLRPLPFPEPDRLVMVWEDQASIGFPRDTPAPANYVDWKTQNRVFQDMAAMSWRSGNLTGDGEPERISAYGVTANFFPLLGVQPALGRNFLPEEDRPGVGKTAILSFNLWQKRYGGDRNIIGKDILLDGEKHRVIGVAPAGFQFLERYIGLWVPQAFTSEELASRDNHYLAVVARMKPGVTLTEAQADIQTITQRIARDYPKEAENMGAAVVSLHEQVAGKTRRPLYVLLGAVAFVLLIACANIAGLLLSRATGRRREIALRSALGASRWRVVRQLLTESILLAGLGGVCGALLASWSFEFLRRLIPDEMLMTASLKIDLPVLGYTLATSLIAGVLFGLAPALQISRIDLNEALKQGGGRGGGASGGRLRGAFVVAEVALALVLLVSAGLLLQTIFRLRGQYSVLHPEKLLTMRTALSQNDYHAHSKRVAFYDQTLERVKSLPGVVSAGFTTSVPLQWKGGANGFSIEDHQPPPGVTTNANHRQISAEYLQTMGVALREGRYFDDRDTLQSMPVVMVNETLARQHWSGASAVGKRIKIGSPDSEFPWLMIVGVVADVRQMDVDAPVKAEMYFPYRQFATHPFFAPRDLVIRAMGDPMSLVPAVRGAVRAVDPNQPISNVATMAELLGEETAARDVGMILLSVFAALALLLASLGIYGVLAYFVAQHTPEIGVRLALGAQRRDVFALVLKRGLTLALGGVGIGLIAAFALTRLLSSLLYEVSATDPTTFVIIPLLLIVVALLACYLPARRATKVDPLIALRYE
jgi:putative ABC transport system permease protein